MRTKADCHRYFTSVRVSATECGAVQDVCYKLGLIDLETRDNGKALLTRIVAMLTKMIMSGVQEKVEVWGP